MKIESAIIHRLAPLDSREAQPGGDKRFRIGAVRPFPQPLDALSDTSLYNLPEGELRIVRVVSEGALWTRLHFINVALPVGAKLFVYSRQNPDDIHGPYEGRGPTKDGAFWTPPMEGAEVVVEYLAPNPATPNAAFNPKSGGPLFQVSEVSHIFLDPLAEAASGGPKGVAGSCSLDVPAAWATIAKSVGHLQFTEGSGESICTGTLLNTTASDGTPYLLTANHCFSTPAAAQSLRVYWLYSGFQMSAPPG